MKLADATSAIVTGGASGLGEATARMLSSGGVKVAIFDMNGSRGEATARDTGGIFCEADVTSESSIDAALARAREAHGVERILVNCAGIILAKRTVTRDKSTARLLSHDLAAFRRVIEVNLVGTYHMIAKCAAAMAALDPITPDGGRGVIIDTASIAATEGQIGQAAYSSSKAGVLGLALPVARDLASFGIRVMTIMPGLFHTPMVDGVTDDVRSTLTSSVLFPARLGLPQEYANLVRSIVENDMLNGEAIRLDGGLRMPLR